MKSTFLLFVSLASAASLGQRFGSQEILKVQNPIQFLEPAEVQDPLQAYAPDCIKTINAGAATVLNAIYEQECALITFSSGVITRDYKYNCCGASTWIRINGADWEKLREAGKLDGLRYQHVTSKDNTYSINFRKMSGKTPGNISPEEFLP
ncbi:hypothetical protein K7432_004158 [Basidiobolus ranarum]|uniref:Uncharacterized protein n=1 Tax=Basidiobolus ranarum TaxID=34480 RepID=A0ABR2W523_9FUNG